MPRFHPATVIEKKRETEDSIVLTLEVPEDAAADFTYDQGQHLPVRASVDGANIRRTYSICSSVSDDVLRLGIRVQNGGVFSNYVADRIDVGDVLEIMPPFGHFNTQLDPANDKTYVACVAGSGITPILSIVKTTLEAEPKSRFVIFYGNRKRASTMFLEELWALKNTYRDRLALHFIMSQETTDIDLYSGRVDGAKMSELHNAFLRDVRADEFFLCGPNPMIDDVTSSLQELGYSKERIHSERFRAGMKGEKAAPIKAAAIPKDGAEITVIVDGNRQSFHMRADDSSILDAALENGIELPYSCKGGVCSTCRTKLKSGDVDMALNYALEPWELERGFILTCQSSPKSSSIELDYDET
ncbi:MAG: 2Fe-2S iron-sulfur cluster binding domain-containing protein [Gammaproteobacteria bacterium]|nr:2Fe-2S iron-sulfur cluster binding domain-containing protein [Gammaproteobacteria bacterium]